MPVKVLLVQLDGKLPNHALMRIAAHHAERGDVVVLRRSPFRQLGDDFGAVYGSAIFDASAPRSAILRQEFPDAVIGGTGSGLEGEMLSVETVLGVPAERKDYSLWPDFTASIGYSQRGCRFKCGFCAVPRIEGPARPVNNIVELWRGPGHPRDICLLDNDFFGQGKSHWLAKINEIHAEGFRVSWMQGINIRVITKEIAEAIASVDFYDHKFKERRLYTAWDNYGERDLFMRGVQHLQRAGVSPSDLFVYMLLGFDPGETWARVEERYYAIRALGAKAYPMVFGDKSRTLPLGGADPRIIKRGLTLGDFQRFAIRPPGQGIRFGEYDRGARGRADGRQTQLSLDAA